MKATRLRPLIACVMILAALIVLESARKTIQITSFQIDQTPVTLFAKANTTGPTVVIAHGFAGSQQMMQGYALPLARAGYRVFAFEFLGHGRHPVPMSGDISAITGTTQLLMTQTHRVIDTVRPGGAPVALLGHSMATDILVRVAETRSDIGPVVLISAFSQVIDATNPRTLLLITGAWEGGLRRFARSTVQMILPDAQESQTVTKGQTTRRAVAAPFSEHVSVLQSRTGRRETLAWLDTAYDRSSDVMILPTGWAILALLGGLVLLFPSLARALPRHETPRQPLSRKRLAIAAIVPMIAAPLIAVPLNPGLLPVLVADYLALHLLIIGLIQLALLRFWRIPSGHLTLTALLTLLIWSAIFGLALDRYAANFWPTTQRLWIIGALAIGAVPYMIADARLAQNTSYLGRIGLRACVLASLGMAVTLDFEGLFFVMMIAPVLVLFYAVFATMGRTTALRSGPIAPGIALGLVLAWALGVSFPLFQA